MSDIPAYIAEVKKALPPGWGEEETAASSSTIATAPERASCTGDDGIMPMRCSSASPARPYSRGTREEP